MCIVPITVTENIAVAGIFSTYRFGGGEIVISTSVEYNQNIKK